MDFRDPIRTELAQFNRDFPKAFSSKVALLDLILRYIVRQKGKQLRPSLVFLVAKAHGAVGERSFRAATLVELMHTATLVHDDVVDESAVRRSMFSISALWKNKIAVLVGDYMLSRVLLLAVEAGDHDLLRTVSTAVRAMSEGELLQIEKARRLDIDESVYYDIIQKKTASLMATCCAAGAESVGADEATVRQASEFGNALGMAFQIQDDLLDYQAYGQSGKPAGIDVREQKMTLPLIFALQRADASTKRELMRIVRRKANDPDRIRTLMTEVAALGGLHYARERRDAFLDEARGILANFPAGEARTALEVLVDFVGQRAK
ncbi:MAG: polyprenyl synthetase family protein [Bacteroidetes bacterium]|nr:polyprenyl synthetase family protein [Bacteroidota bacterium]